MNKKVERIIQDITRNVSAWQGVECLVVMENENDSHDPYFFLSFDVYFDRDLPDAAARQELLAKAGAFETNSQGLKDRFLLEEIAIRLEYKSCRHYDFLMPGKPLHAGGESGTYSLYRIANGRVLYQKSSWMSHLRAALTVLPPEFWRDRREECQLSLEHCLADMEAARIRQDRLFYTLSFAGFIGRLCGTLFALNQRFEPNRRLIKQELLALPVLPESFNGSLDILLRFGELPLDRHCEIAALITRQVISL